MRLLFVLAIGGACGLAPGNVTDDAAVVSGALAYCGGRGEGLFQYMHLRYCALGAAPGAAAVALLALWLLLLISLLATTADCYFVPQLEALSGYLQLSPEVAGITLLALGNGAPDVFAARAALRRRERLPAHAERPVGRVASCGGCRSRSDGAWDRRRRVFTAMAPPFLGLVVTLDSPWADGNGFDYAFSGGAAAPALVAAAVGAAASAAVWLTTDDAAPPRYYVLVVLAAFACTITWLDLVASELVAVIGALGRILGCRRRSWLTVIAMGNSVGDLVADTATATHLSPQMAVASCFGSPLLNDILGVGVATTAYAAKHGALASPLNAQDRVAYAFLLASLLSSLAAFPALGFFAEEKTAARARYPYALFGLYGAFALVSCLVELDVIPQDRICALGNGGSCLRTSS
ncbi:calcium:sodium antiporter [Aureococcus anophagefferens]|nr:calcium:sodium antiporter [Aureococcus anophagefferens]